MKWLLFITVFIIGTNNRSFSQFKFVDSCSQFNLYLKIENPYSDTIAYGYFDCEKNLGIKEKILLVNREVRISGFINRAAEVIIYTNIYAPFEDSSFLRIIIEPGDIKVKLIMDGSNIINEVTEGSVSQNERQKWNTENSILLRLEDKYRKEYSSFLRNSPQMDSSEQKKSQWGYQQKIEVLSELRAAIALEYIKSHVDSYFSGALLFQFKRLYTTDTAMKYFNTLAANVQQSDFGKYLLNDLLKRTGNWDIFSNYIDSMSLKKLKNIKNIYDVSLTALNGKTMSFTKFKNKILLIDFWASWCTPCIANIPAINQLAEEFKKYPVEIISVSMDSNEKTWRSAIKKNDFKGNQLLDKDGLLSAYYKVLGVPKYIIIDQNGNLIDGDAPYPKGGNLKKKLLEIVGKEYKY